MRDVRKYKEDWVMNSQRKELRESGLFRQKALDRFLNGMEPDSSMMLQALPLKIGIGAFLAFGGTLLVWWFVI